jgi:hypothetical protein
VAFALGAYGPLLGAAWAPPESSLALKVPHEARRPGLLVTEPGDYWLCGDFPVSILHYHPLSTPFTGMHHLLLPLLFGSGERERVLPP